MSSGSCICGNIAYAYSVEPVVTALCHCLDYQKWTGSANSVNVVIPTAELSVTKGSPKKFVRQGESGQAHTHFFCAGSFGPAFSFVLCFQIISVEKGKRI
ncbi:Mss4-like protein [Xylariales sp. PMI_506]|nr:Mss4-like protein [Xylariales sp. PMI_506]